MRDKFKVVEWNFFLSQLEKRSINNVADVSDALHFLANIGELSYFGNVAAVSCFDMIIIFVCSPF
jgi:hypothetical protein